MRYTSGKARTKRRSIQSLKRIHVQALLVLLGAAIAVSILRMVQFGLRPLHALFIAESSTVLSYSSPMENTVAMKSEERSASTGYPCIEFEGTRDSFICSNMRRQTGCTQRITAGDFVGKSTDVDTSPNALDWNQVVVVLFTSIGREEFLKASSTTWLRRLLQCGDGLQLVIASAAGTRFPIELLQHKRVSMRLHRSYSYGELDERAFDAFRFAREKFPRTKFFIKVDDDAILIGDWLLKFLRTINLATPHSIPMLFGTANCKQEHEQMSLNGFRNSGCHPQGGVYGLNLAAVEILSGAKCKHWADLLEEQDKEGKDDDVSAGKLDERMMARCLNEAGNVSITHCGSFFDQSPSHYAKNLFGYELDRFIGKTPISFHNLAPSAIRTIDNFLYDAEAECSPRTDLTFNSDGDMRARRFIAKCRKVRNRMECNSFQPQAR